jgi:hypothetical protein
MDIQAERVLGESLGRHWSYRAKGDAIRRLLGPDPVRHVLDVGAGSGHFARLLLDHGATEATCVDQAYPAQFETMHGGKPIRFVHQVEDSSADLVLLIDVLSAADDDAGMLRGYALSAVPGTRFLITVPAFASLWSGRDVFLRHRRRYTLPALESLVREAGLRPVTGCYLYSFCLPFAATSFGAERLTQRAPPGAKLHTRRRSKWLNAALYALCRLELAFLRRNRLAGLTIFCAAER